MNVFQLTSFVRQMTFYFRWFNLNPIRERTIKQCIYESQFSFYDSTARLIKNSIAPLEFTYVFTKIGILPQLINPTIDQINCECFLFINKMTEKLD